jgi:copper(I)-binding protein
LLLLLPVIAQAEYLEVKDAWVRVAPPNARVMVAYATIVNNSEDTIWITAASSDGFDAVEMHETIEENGMASMIHLDFIQLEAGQTVNFAPGGKHFMLFRPVSQSNPGDQIRFYLHLGNGDKEAFTAVVSRDTPNK